MSGLAWGVIAHECGRLSAPTRPDSCRDYEYNDEGTIYFIRPDGGTQWEDPRE